MQRMVCICMYVCMYVSIYLSISESNVLHGTCSVPLTACLACSLCAAGSLGTCLTGRCACLYAQGGEREVRALVEAEWGAEACEPEPDLEDALRCIVTGTALSPDYVVYHEANLRRWGAWSTIEAYLRRWGVLSTVRPLCSTKRPTCAGGPAGRWAGRLGGQLAGRVGSWWLCGRCAQYPESRFQEVSRIQVPGGIQNPGSRRYPESRFQEVSRIQVP